MSEGGKKKSTEKKNIKLSLIASHGEAKVLAQKRGLQLLSIEFSYFRVLSAQWPLEKFTEANYCENNPLNLVS